MKTANRLFRFAAGVCFAFLPFTNIQLFIMGIAMFYFPISALIISYYVGFGIIAVSQFTGKKVPMAIGAALVCIFPAALTFKDVVRAVNDGSVAGAVFEAVYLLIWAFLLVATAVKKPRVKKIFGGVTIGIVTAWAAAAFYSFWVRGAGYYLTAPHAVAVIVTFVGAVTAVIAGCFTEAGEKEKKPTAEKVLAGVFCSLLAAAFIGTATFAVVFAINSWRAQINYYRPDYENFSGEFETVKNGLSGCPDGIYFTVKKDAETGKYGFAPVRGLEQNSDEVLAALNAILEGNCFECTIGYVNVKDGQIIMGNESDRFAFVWSGDEKPRMKNHIYNQKEYVVTVGDGWYLVVYAGW